MRIALVGFTCLLSGCITVPIGDAGNGGGDSGLFSNPLTVSDDAQFDDPSPDNFDEDLFLAHVNDERGNVAVQPVVYNDLLTEAAQAHAEDLVENDYFSHIGLDGSTPADRVSETGYEWAWVAENLFQGSTKEEAAIETWMESTDGHREAMLAEEAQEIGVGFEDTTYVLILADPL